MCLTLLQVASVNFSKQEHDDDDGTKRQGAENARVENTGAITYGKPSEQKTKIPGMCAKTKRSLIFHSRIFSRPCDSYLSRHIHIPVVSSVSLFIALPSRRRHSLRGGRAGMMGGRDCASPASSQTALKDRSRSDSRAC